MSKEFTTSSGPWRSLSYSLEPNNGRCPETDEISSYPHPIYLRPILIHLCLALRSFLFASGYPTKILYEFLISPMRTHMKNKLKTIKVKNMI